MDELAMGWIRDEIGRAVGLPREIGGVPLDEIGATGFGIVSAIDVARRHIDMPLERARVVIQGFGSAGKHAARFLAEKAAVLIGASDTRGTIVDENGLDLAALIALKAEGRGLPDYPGGRKLAADAVIDIRARFGFPRHGRMSSTPATWHACKRGSSPKGPISRARRKPNRCSLLRACSSCPTSSPMPAA
jgi:glutamate dehydrogenase/leucine dehydrogenase